MPVKNPIEYQRKQRRERRKMLIKLLGNVCVKCGSNNKLEFDHKNRKLKKFTIAVILSSKMSKLMKEVKKCQLLCKKCHINKSIIERKDKIAVHGSMGMYSNHGCRCIKCKNVCSRYYKKYNLNNICNTK